MTFSKQKPRVQGRPKTVVVEEVYYEYGSDYEEDVDMGGLYGGDDEYGDCGGGGGCSYSEPIRHTRTVTKTIMPTFTTAASRKLDMNQLLRLAKSEGCWDLQSRDVIIMYIEGSDQDARVLEALSHVNLAQGTDGDAVYLTLLACHILTKAYRESASEWQLIVSKAKSWLTRVGLPKPASLIKKFTVAVKD